MPVLSECAEQPVMDELLQDYEDHKKSEEYKKAVEQSEPRNQHPLRYSQALWWAEQKEHQKKQLWGRARQGKCHT